jgi:sulfatase maturation enzyme AslB (radical SAM superfamily)
VQIVVSVDGLQPEHDRRRAPATYDRTKHIRGHQVTVHCTITRQQVQREGYIEEFVRLWSENQDTRQIWVSLYTPQVGEVSDEILQPADRESVIATLMVLRKRYPKLKMPAGLIACTRNPLNRRTTVSSPGRRHASRRISSAGSRRVSSVARPIAPTAAASHRRR